MGLAAAVAVTVAVLVALTLLPAIALLLGERLRPAPAEAEPAPTPEGRRRKPTRAGSRRVERSAPAWVARGHAAPGGDHRRRRSVLLVLAAVPALSMRLALPDNSTAPPPRRSAQTYDKITAAFGEGYNAPAVGDRRLITSTDPQRHRQRAGRRRSQDVPDVVAVPAVDAQRRAATPAWSRSSPRRARRPPSTATWCASCATSSAGWEKEYGVTDILVTGQTAVNIDVSDRLGGALLPFARHRRSACR